MDDMIKEAARREDRKCIILYCIVLSVTAAIMAFFIYVSIRRAIARNENCRQKRQQRTYDLAIMLNIVKCSM
jgi:hypothetical protein